MKKLDRRKSFQYLGVIVVPESGDSQYFGCTHAKYLTRWWKLTFRDESWVLSGTKKDAKKYIEKYLSPK